MLTQAQEILKMIEAVSPDDTAKLDEIDARAHIFIHNEKWGGAKIDWTLEHIAGFPQCLYTRSRNALKAVRPKGFLLTLSFWPENKCTAYLAHKVSSYVTPEAPFLPNEELAELHAIIQAIEYERNLKC